MAAQVPILGSVALLAVLAPGVLAQNNGGGNNRQTTENTPAESSSAANDNTDETSSQEPTATAKDTKATSADLSGLPGVTITGSPTTGSGNEDLNDLPTLTNAPVVVTYAPPAVPPTNDAPFMQRSTLPDGTVFIAVGAILGTFGLAVLIWRAVVACLLHRSVERAAAAQLRANEKSTFLAPPAAFYKSNDRESSPSLGAAAGRGARRTTRGPTPSATPSQTNLFFSPTAAGSSAMANRDSRFLPSGFYAAGQSPSPAMGTPGHGHSMSFSNLRPDSRGNYSRNTMREPSPEGSPQFTAAMGRRDPSMSSLNLNRPPSQRDGGRAPSAYLEDLLDDNPAMFPPAQMPPGGPPRHAHTFSHQSGHGRY